MQRLCDWVKGRSISVSYIYIYNQLWFDSAVCICIIILLYNKHVETFSPKYIH